MRTAALETDRQGQELAPGWCSWCRTDHPRTRTVIPGLPLRACRICRLVHGLAPVAILLREGS